MTSTDLLRIYLRDHHAGEVAGCELAKRSAKANRGTPFGTMLEGIARDLAEDREAIERIMATLGVSPAKGKDAAAWTAEKLGRLKLNGAVTSYSPLSRVLELEGLSLVVQTKKILLETLEQLADERLPVAEVAPLKARADDQLKRLNGAWRDAVDVAFSTAGSIT